MTPRANSLAARRVHSTSNPTSPRRRAGLAVPEDPSIATFARADNQSLTAARSLASQIENMNLPGVVAASPVKAIRPDGSEGWMVRIAYTSSEVPRPIRSLPSVKEVSWDLKTSSNEAQGRAWLRLGIVSALMWTGIAVAGGTAVWWLVSAATQSESSS